MSAGISVFRHARKDEAIASSKFSSSMLLFSAVNISFNVFRSFIVGGVRCSSLSAHCRAWGHYRCIPLFQEFEEDEDVRNMSMLKVVHFA